MGRHGLAQRERIERRCQIERSRETDDYQQRGERGLLPAGDRDASGEPKIQRHEVPGDGRRQRNQEGLPGAQQRADGHPREQQRDYRRVSARGRQPVHENDGKQCAAKAADGHYPKSEPRHRCRNQKRDRRTERRA